MGNNQAKSKENIGSNKSSWKAEFKMDPESATPRIYTPLSYSVKP